MYTLFRMNADELDSTLLESIKTLFKGQTIEIAVSDLASGSDDETTYLLRDPANRSRLLQALENVESGDVVTVDLDTLM